MQSLMRSRLITFDVTGTLLKTNLEKDYVKVAERFGVVGLDKAKLSQSFKKSFKRLEKEHPIYGKTTGLGWEPWWRILVQDVFRDQLPDIKTDTLNKVCVKS